MLNPVFLWRWAAVGLAAVLAIERWPNAVTHVTEFSAIVDLDALHLVDAGGLDELALALRAWFLGLTCLARGARGLLLAPYALTGPQVDALLSIAEAMAAAGSEAARSLLDCVRRADVGGFGAQLAKIYFSGLGPQSPHRGFLVSRPTPRGTPGLTLEDLDAPSAARAYDVLLHACRARMDQAVADIYNIVKPLAGQKKDSATKVYLAFVEMAKIVATEMLQSVPLLMASGQGLDEGLGRGDRRLVSGADVDRLPWKHVSAAFADCYANDMEMPLVEQFFFVHQFVAIKRNACVYAEPTPLDVGMTPDDAVFMDPKQWIKGQVDNDQRQATKKVNVEGVVIQDPRTAKTFFTCIVLFLLVGDGIPENGGVDQGQVEARFDTLVTRIFEAELRSDKAGLKNKKAEEVRSTMHADMPRHLFFEVTPAMRAFGPALLRMPLRCAFAHSTVHAFVQASHEAALRRGTDDDGVLARMLPMKTAQEIDEEQRAAEEAEAKAKADKKKKSKRKRNSVGGSGPQASRHRPVADDSAPPGLPTIMAMMAVE